MTEGVRDASPLPRADMPCVDFAFLAAQTFGDDGLEREILALFLAQARACLPELPTLGRRAQDDLVHKLKGSCQGIGARAATLACLAVEAADDATRPAALAGLAAAFAATKAAIEAHLASSLLTGGAVR